MTPKKDDNIISQSTAAQKAGVSRQAISSLKTNGSSYNFFTPDGKVNTTHPDWLNYIEERKNKSGQGGKSADNNLQSKGKRKSEDGSGNKSHGESKKQTDRASSRESEKEDKTKYNKEHALTGGYDPSMFPPSNASQLKSLTDIQAKSLEMRIKLGEYIHRDVVVSYIEKIQIEVQQIINLGRTVSQDICERLERLGMHTEVEKIINPKTEKLRDSIVEKCNSIKRLH